MDISSFNIKGDESPEEIFARDLKLAEESGVKEPLAMPSFSRRSKRGVLLIHGFVATPYEMHYVAKALEERDLTVYNCRVAGHGINVDALIKTSYVDWYESLKMGLSALYGCCDKIAVIGQSNGGLLACATALNNKVDALGLLAPAFKVRILGFPLVKYFRYVLKSVPRKLREEDKAYNYNAFPLESTYQLKLLQDYVGERLLTLSMPMMLGISQNDILVSEATAIEYFSNIKAVDKTLHIYDNRSLHISHILTRAYMDTIRKDIADWAERVLNG